MIEGLGTVSQLLRAQAQALSDLADVLDAGSPIPVGAASAVAGLPILRGSRQRQVVDLPGLDAESGMKTAYIAEAIVYSGPNTHAMLQKMERAGIVERVAGSTVTRWRLAPRYRNRSAAFAGVAALIRCGEWATYGDISLAVGGNLGATDLVKQAAMTHPGFPHPQRVLSDGGVISPSWRDCDGRGPEDCRRALVAEGIEFTGGVAHQRQRATWDELRHRDEDRAAQQAR